MLTQFSSFKVYISLHAKIQNPSLSPNSRKVNTGERLRIMKVIFRIMKVIFWIMKVIFRVMKVAFRIMNVIYSITKVIFRIMKVIFRKKWTRRLMAAAYFARTNSILVTKLVFVDNSVFATYSNIYHQFKQLFG